MKILVSPRDHKYRSKYPRTNIKAKDLLQLPDSIMLRRKALAEKGLDKMKSSINKGPPPDEAKCNH
jgi:TPP-dependent pyruvate/acetoin dehydrogenase alpha subunit